MHRRHILPGGELGADAREAVLVGRNAHHVDAASGLRRDVGDETVGIGGRGVVTTGTFLRGLIHIGEKKRPAGRVGEAPAMGLSLTLERRL